MTTSELVINFHMTETCNFRCDYCYATWQDNAIDSELHHSSQSINALLELLADYFFNANSLQKSMGYSGVRINFAGGEPVMLGSRFIEALDKAKSLGFSTSLITNGHLLTKNMLKRISPKLDILGLSFDTADQLISQSIGRVDRKNSWLSPERLIEIASSYRNLNSKGLIKINTVVNAMNWRENLSKVMCQLRPNKWKLLRVLPVYNQKMTISSEQYRSYINRHQQYSEIITVENNQDMWQSYLMINPQGCFYQNSTPCQGFSQSPPILNVGVDSALSYITFDTTAFARRYKNNPAIQINPKTRYATSLLSTNEATGVRL